ncbi:MAG: hypothetical protein ACRED4_03080 [Brevundimonas sp.]
MSGEKETRKQVLNDLSDDTLGFGGTDLRTVRDLLLQPKAVLEGWMTHGPTGGGAYSRPLKLYLALNAILMLICFLRGGFGYLLDALPPELLTSVLQQSGKSRDAFVGDADNWMSLVIVPLTAPLLVVFTTPLFRWWDPEDLRWRRGVRASLAYLNAWTVLMLPFSWFMYGAGPAAMGFTVLFSLMGVVAFLRMGRGRWYKSYGPGVGKSLIVLLAMQIVGIIATSLVAAVGLFAGRFA